MTPEKCYQDLKEIFTRPGEFSTELSPGRVYTIADDEHLVLRVGRRWGYHAIVLDVIQKYFDKNGNVDNGGGVSVSPNDIIGTAIKLLTKEEIDRLIN